MKLFGNNFTKEGPGISKDAPPKKGLALFFDILMREFWNLIKLNLLFVLACVPIVTIFPAISGMTYVISKMVRDENSFVWSDFWKGFRNNWKQSYILGVINVLTTISALSSFYLAIIQSQTLFFALGMAITLFSSMFFMTAYTMLVTVDLPVYSVLKNSLILSISCLNYLLPAAIVSLAIWLLAINFIIYILPFLVFILFSFTWFIAVFAAWAGIKKYVIKEENKETSQT